MRSLRLPLDDIDFEQLVQLGRAVIPTIAPAWTDHNTHDPGIMLLELVSWVADAQIYALSRLRRDERRAYARLLGIEAHGPRPASGLIWPLAAGAAGAGLPWAPGTRLDAGTVVISDHPKAPSFTTTQTVTLTTATLVDVFTEFHDKTRRSWMGVNTQQGATFLPFGEEPHAGDRLVLALRGAPGSDQDTEATVAIGVETASSPTQLPDASAAARADEVVVRRPARLRVTLVDLAGRSAARPLDVVADTTQGFARRGVLVVRVPAGLGRQQDVALTIASARGAFLRPPRLQQIALNVLPIAQIETVREEVPLFGRDVPDQSYALERDGVLLPLDAHPWTVRVSEGADWPDWERVEDLSIVGPARRAYTVDVARRIVQFGNGINGRKPARGAALQVAYQVTAGTSGNLPAGLTWSVAGVAGPFGTNSEAMSGGRAAEQLDDLRALARRRSRETHPIVTAGDLEQAALAFPDLGVTRVMELPPDRGPHRVRGTRVLVVVGPSDSPIWFEELRARLAPRLPLGQRLQIIAPEYVDIQITAHLVARRNVDPIAVRDRALASLRSRLNIAPSTDGPGWPFGRDVTLLAVKGWLRNVDGVATVRDVQVSAGGPAGATVIAIGSVALPRTQITADDIQVDRAPVGATR